MTRHLPLAAAAIVAALLLAGCAAEPAPDRPAPVAIPPTPSTGTVVVQPQS